MAHARAAEIVAAVRECVGTRFRAQGRLPGTGLDCVGVALVGMAAAGTPSPGLAAYSLGGDGQASCLRRGLGRTGCVELGAEMREPGDLLVYSVASDRPHLAVQTGGEAMVHADLGLRAVVEGPSRAGWLLQSVWRFAAGD